MSSPLAYGPVDVLFLQPPSPPRRNVLRDYAGGFGVSLPSRRAGYGHDEVTQPNLSLVYAFSAVRRHYVSVFLDAQAEHLDCERLRQRGLDMMPSVIVATLNLPSLDSDLEILASLKAVTDAQIVAIGTVCRAIPDDVLADGTVDVAVSGDAEVVGEPLVRALLGHTPLNTVRGITRRTGEGIVSNPGGLLDDLDTLPMPALEALPLDGYKTWEFGLKRQAAGKQFGGLPTYFPLYFSRGCPYGCAYCPYPLGFGRTWRRKSAEHVADEFTALAAAGVGHALLRDQTIAEDEGYLHEVCDALIDSACGVRWLTEARLGSLDSALLKKMHRAGCVRLHYGIETGDPEMFESEGKRGVGYENIARGLNQTEEAGILPSAHFLLGFPDESWASIERTVGLIDELGIANGDCALMTPYPGTRQYEQLAEEGRILARSWSRFTGDDPIVRLDELSPVELSLGRWYVLRAIRANKGPTMRSRLRAAAHALSAGGRDDDVQLREAIKTASGQASVV